MLPKLFGWAHSASKSREPESFDFFRAAKNQALIDAESACASKAEICQRQGDARGDVCTERWLGPRLAPARGALVAREDKDITKALPVLA